MFYWVLPSFSGRCWVTRNLILLESYEGFLFFFFYKPDMGKERNAIGGSWPPLIGGNSAKLLANQVEQLGRIHQVGESRVETRVFAYLRVDVVLFCLFVCLFVFVRERFENWSSSGGLRIFDAFTEFFLSFFLCVCCFLGFVFWFSRYCARSVTELFSLLFVAAVVVVVVVERRLGRRPVT